MCNARSDLSQDHGGTWAEYGIGASFNTTPASSAYADFGKTTGGEVESSWNWSPGVRYVWKLRCCSGCKFVFRPLRQKTIGGPSVAKASNRAADFHPEFSCSFHSTGVHSVSWLEPLRSRAACRDTPSNTPLNQDRWRFRQCSKSKYIEQAEQQWLSDTIE